jgi:hypothetical protein
MTHKVSGMYWCPLAVGLGSWLTLTVGDAQALTIDNFSTGSTGNLFYDGALSAAPASGFLGSTTLAAVTASGPSALIATASPGEQLFVSVVYAGLGNMSLDLSGQNAFRFDVPWLGNNLGTSASPVSLTIYANTIPVPGTNGTGSAINTALTAAGTFDVAFSSFFINSASGVPVNWADVDQLGFAFSGLGPQGLETLAGFRINSISTVPETDIYTMLATGLALLTWLTRRSAGHP